MSKKLTFDLEHQYKLYLQRMNMRETDMHPTQRLQLKQTFYGAAGQVLILLRDDLSALPEEEGIKMLDNLISQVLAYFTHQN